MATITKDEILKLAKLSNILVKEEEIADILPKIEAVLAYAVRVKELAPGSQLPSDIQKNSNITRPDIVIATEPEPILGQGPQVEGNYFVVPAIIKQN